MSNVKNPYEGMVWALTPEARATLNQLEGVGIHPSLAFAVIDNLIEQGLAKESEIYELPAPNEDRDE